MYLFRSLLAVSLKRIDAWKLYTGYLNVLVKRSRCFQRIKFIQHCLQADIIPRFLKFRVPENGCFEPQVVHNFQRKLLRVELTKARKVIELHNQSLLAKRTLLQNAIPEKMIPSVVFFTRLAVQETKNSVEQTHQKKLIALSEEQQRPLFQVHDTVKIFDADIKPPQYVLDTLALGPKNATMDKFDPKEVLTQMDSLLYRCKRDRVSSDAMNSINVATFKYIKACEKQKTSRNCTMPKKYLLVDCSV